MEDQYLTSLFDHAYAIFRDNMDEINELIQNSDQALLKNLARFAKASYILHLGKLGYEWDDDGIY